MTTWTKRPYDPSAFPAPDTTIPTGDFFARPWFDSGFFTGLGHSGIWTGEGEPSTSWSDATTATPSWTKNAKATSHWT